MANVLIGFSGLVVGILMFVSAFNGRFSDDADINAFMAGAGYLVIVAGIGIAFSFWY